MLLLFLCLLLLSTIILPVSPHGALTYPASNRVGGSLDSAGSCELNQCVWFSQIAKIPGQPTVNDPKYRTYNIEISGCGPDDWTCQSPWRAPGTAPVLGSGCGIAGGAAVPLWNGGFAPPGIPQGADALDVLAAQPPVRWETGSIQEVAWAITANHGGGYSYRLCKADDRGSITEECFQQNQLKFAGDTQYLQWASSRVPHSPRYEIPRTTVTEGVYPPGSEWAKNPIPGCNMCDPVSACGGVSLSPNYTDSTHVNWGPTNLTYYGGPAWIEQVFCGTYCAGENYHDININGGRTDGRLCGEQLQFPEPIPGRSSGFIVNHTYPDISVDAFSIVDKIIVPQDLSSGHYLLSWRWDCEQSFQVWMNCADIEIVATNDNNMGNNQNDDHYGMASWQMALIIALAVVCVVSILVNVYYYCQKRANRAALDRYQMRIGMNESLI